MFNHTVLYRTTRMNVQPPFNNCGGVIVIARGANCNLIEGALASGRVTTHATPIKFNVNDVAIQVPKCTVVSTNTNTLYTH